MKRIILPLIVLFLILENIFSKGQITFSGQYESIFDSKQAKKYKFNDYGKFAWGWENFANLRMKANVNEYLSFNLAANVSMLSGNSTETFRQKYSAFSQSILSGGDTFYSIPFYYKDSYIGAFELERMYFKSGNDYFNISGGLMRFSHGYGSVFKPMDFVNPANPMNKNLRPDGRLGLNAAFYPTEMWEIETFVIAPENPVKEEGWGFKIGADTKINLKKVGMEFLYTLSLPEIEYGKAPSTLGLPDYVSNDFSHLFGFGLKADVFIGLFFEATYKFDQSWIKKKSYYGEEYYFYRGLNFSLGADYTIPIAGTDFKFYLLAEYYFNGAGYIDWNDKNLNKLYSAESWKKYSPYDRSSIVENDKKTLVFNRHDYIYGLVKWTINTYISISTSYLFGIDDQSALPGWNIEIEPFQSMTINIDAAYPLGWEVVNSSWNAGELGSVNLGYYQDYRISLKIKF